jgi:NAD(P)-dependent dehydrogenase (short-subunit alcohol dehydrogenase family)
MGSLRRHRRELTVLAVVVGGGSGIGRAIVESYKAKGETAVVWDIAGPHDVECDVTDPESVTDALAQTIERAGLPDQLTITAGIGHSGLLLEESIESWDRVIGVNARGPWLVMRAVARAMVDEKRAGSIVATSSVSAHLVDRAMGLYCASKAALSMIVKVAATEWASYGIRVNAVGPGVTETPMLGRAPTDSGWLQAVTGRTPLGRLGQPSDIAQATLALHDLSWVTGQVLDCDGGLSLHSPIDAFGKAQRAGGGL